MVLQFRGVAHPPPGVSEPDIANLNAAEISLTNLGDKGGAPLLFEHNSGHKIGVCLASWEGRNGELRVAGVVNDPQVERTIRNGSNRGLSLGTDVLQDREGNSLYKNQAELSVCAEPRRRGCYIDTLDGKSVHSRRHFSNGEGTFSKEYVERLKADLAAKAEEASKLKAFKNQHDDKQREVISKLQPDIQGFIEGLVKDNVDYAQDMRPLQEWSRSCHESQSLDTAMPLARVISCASAQFKRTREEASVLSEKATTLSATMKELEETKAADSVKAQRIVELEALAMERQNANTKLQEELAKAGLVKDKFDFSKVASREADPKDNENAPVSNGESSMTSITSNASRGPAMSMEDELMSFVRGSSNNLGSGKIQQSSTAHSFVGTSQSGLDSEIASAIRGY